MIHIIINTLILIINIISNTYFSIRNKEIAEKKMKNAYIALPDIIQDNLIITPINIPDYFIFFLFIILFTKIFYYNLKIINLYENLYCLNFSLLLRSIIIPLTILPSPMPIILVNKHNIYQKIFNSSHDLIFSGHTLIFIFLSNLIYCNNIIFYTISIISKYFLPFLLVTSKQHYTIDIVIAMFIYRYFMYFINDINFIN